MVAAALLVFAVAASAAPNNDWNVVAKLSPGTRVQLATAKSRLGGTVVRGSADALAVQGESGEVSVARADVKEVKIAAPSKRKRSGLISTGVGAAIGFTIGWLICVHCTNEGHSGFFWQGMGIGAGLGALGFAPLPFDTIYKAPKK